MSEYPERRQDTVPMPNFGLTEFIDPTNDMLPPLLDSSHLKTMAAKGKKKLLKQSREPEVASVVLEVSARSGAPMSARDKFRLRQALRQFARQALKN